MQVIPILLVAVVLAADAGVRWTGGPEFGHGTSVTVALLPVAVLALVAWVSVHLGLRGLDRHRRVAPLLRADRIVRLCTIGLVIVHVHALMVADWLGAIRSLIGDVILLDEVLALLPPVIGLSMLRWIEYPLERRVREALLLRRLDAGEPIFAPPSRREFVSQALRMQLAFALVPVLLIIGFAESAERLVESQRFQLEGWAAALPSWAGVLIVIFTAPLIAERLLNMRRAGCGALRDDVEAMARRHRIRIGELVIWRTGGGLVNAAVMGVLPWVRRVILTDALVELLRSEEVRAVVAHELGHLRHRHLAWTLLGMMSFLFASAVLIGAMSSFDPLLAQIGSAGVWIEVVFFGAALIGAVGLFGWVSRRFEQQADAFATRVMSEDASLSVHPGAEASVATAVGPGVVMLVQETLERVALLNGSDPARRSWRHGSIRKRQEALTDLIGCHPQQFPIDRSVRRIKRGIALLLTAALLAQAGFMIFERTLG